MARRGGHDDDGALSEQAQRQRQRALARQRRVRRQRILGVIVAVLVIAGLGYGAYAWVSGGDAPDAPSEVSAQAAAPVRVDIGPPPEEADEEPVGDAEMETTTGGTTTKEFGYPPDEEATTKGSRTSSTARTTPRAPKAKKKAAAGGGAEAGSERAGATPAAGRPVVWIQAGHADPREPGYMDQSGTGSGPFGSEIGFTTDLGAKVVAQLTRAGVDARITYGRVEPLGASGVAFVSLHHDSPGGAAAFGHAITGAGENYYHGEGSGDPSPTPYSDSATHRQATTVTGQVESRSLSLANAIEEAYRPIYTAANGASGRYGGVQTREGNPRMMRYYGFYRTNADARVIVEAGAGGSDDAFLAKTEMIATAVSHGILTHLKKRGLIG